MSRSQQAPHRTLLSFFVSQPPQSCPNYITPRSRSDIMIHLRHLIAMPSLSSPPYNPLPKKARNATLLSLSRTYTAHISEAIEVTRDKESLSLTRALGSQRAGLCITGETFSLLRARRIHSSFRGPARAHNRAQPPSRGPPYILAARRLQKKGSASGRRRRLLLLLLLLLLRSVCSCSAPLVYIRTVVPRESLGVGCDAVVQWWREDFSCG